MSDLADHERIIDSKLFIMLVSTDDCIISTKSKKMHSKVVDHLKQCFLATTKEVNSLNYLNYRVTQSYSFVAIDLTPFTMSVAVSHVANIKHTTVDTIFRADC